MPPVFDLLATCTCHRCGRIRELPDRDEASTLMKGDQVVVLRASAKCPQCGDDRVSIKARVTMGG